MAIDNVPIIIDGERQILHCSQSIIIDRMVRDITSLPMYNVGYYRWGHRGDIMSLVMYNPSENISVFMDGPVQVLSIM